MINIITNLEIRMGEQYFKDETGSLRIDCKVGLIRVWDLNSNMVYSKEYDKYDTSPIVLKILAKGNIKTAIELIEYLISKTDFKMREFSKVEILNPFFKELEGELKIKSKAGYFTKTQVEKILKHKDTRIIRDYAYTDDYAYDAYMNFNKGTEISRLDMLEEVRQSFSRALTYENGEFTLLTVGHSKSAKVINPNITII